VFKHLDFHIGPAEHAAIVGPNGSGKSTLMHLIAGQVLPTEGNILYHQGNTSLIREQWYATLSWTSPAMELYTDLTLEEHLRMHFSFKSCRLDSFEQIIPLIDLEKHRNKPLKFFSSGMLQKVKVAQTLFSDTPLLLLDEPTSFMDDNNAALTLRLLQEHAAGRTLLLASNIEREHRLLSRKILL